MPNIPNLSDPRYSHAYCYRRAQCIQLGCKCGSRRPTNAKVGALAFHKRPSYGCSGRVYSGIDKLLKQEFDQADFLDVLDNQQHCFCSNRLAALSQAENIRFARESVDRIEAKSVQKFA